MATYEQSNFAQIGNAIGMDVARIAKRENLFEAAALWYRLGKRQPTRIAPSKLREKLDQVAKSARRLLKSLGVNGPAEAADGPGNIEILAALVLASERNEDPIIEATRRIGRLAEIIDGVAAAADFERRAKLAATEVTRVPASLLGSWATQGYCSGVGRSRRVNARDRGGDWPHEP
jgi:hypothetical protein